MSQNFHRFRISIKPISITKVDENNPVNKSILIKIEDTTVKSEMDGTVMEFQAQASYSSESNKYTPIKSIIKIYDILENGKEIISCVGAFQISHLSSGVNKEIINKKIGGTQIVMEITCEKVEESEKEHSEMKEEDDDVVIESAESFKDEIKISENKENAKIKKSNTINTVTEDIVDLKSAVNFGVALSRFSPQASPSSQIGGSRLSAKAASLHNKNQRKFPSVGKLLQGSEIDSLRRNESFEDSEDYGNMELSIYSNSSREKKQNNENNGNPNILPTLDKQSNSNYSLSESNFNEQDRPQIDMHKSNRFEMTDSLKVANFSIKLGSRSWEIDESVEEIMKGIENMNNSNNLNHSNQLNNSNNLNLIQRVDSSENLSYKNNENIVDLSVSNASVSNSMILEYQKLEGEILGEQLIEERRKNRENEEKINRLYSKTIAIRDRHIILQNSWQHWCDLSYNFLKNVYQDHNGKYVVEVDQKKENIIIKYDLNEESETAFINFMIFTIENSRQSHHVKKNENSPFLKPNNNLNSEMKTRSHSEISGEHFNSFQKSESQQSKLREEFEFELGNLRKTITDLSKKLEEERQKNQKLSEEKKDLSKQLSHQIKITQEQQETISNLRTKEEHLENILKLKESSIASLKKSLSSTNTELDTLEEELAELKKTNQNLHLLLEELNEELADREETIEMLKGEKNGKGNENKNALKMGNLEDFDGLIQKIIEENSQALSQQGDSFGDNGSSISGNMKSSFGKSSLSNIRELRSDRGLLLSLVRNQEKIYKLKLEEAKSAHNEMSLISNKIGEYITKLEDESNLFQSVK